VPTAPVTVAVSLADKIDSLFQFYLINEKPTGSKDPFALRRAAIGLAALVLGNGLRLRLRDLLDFAGDIEEAYCERTPEEEWTRKYGYGRADLARLGFPELVDAKSKKDIDFATGFLRGYPCGQARDGVVEFIVDRLKVQQREAGVRHDLIDAVFALGGEDDLVRLLARVKALQGFVETGDGTNLLVAYKRAANILKKEKWDDTQAPDQVRGDDLAGEEAALVAALDAAEPKAAVAVEAEDFTGAMAALASLRAPIDTFFDKVTVNDPDEAKRERRLNLLLRFRDAVNRVADFSRIEG